MRARTLATLVTAVAFASIAPSCGGGPPPPVAAPSPTAVVTATPLSASSALAGMTYADPPPCPPLVEDGAAARPHAMLQRLPAGNLVALSVSPKGELALVADDGEIVLGDLAARILTTELRRKSASLARWETALWDAAGEKILIVDPEGVTSIDRAGQEQTSKDKLAFPKGRDLANSWYFQSAATGEVAALSGPLGADAQILVWARGKRSSPATVIAPTGSASSVMFSKSGDVLAFTVVRREARAGDQDPKTWSEVFLVRGDGSEAPTKARFSLPGRTFTLRDLSRDASLALLATDDAELLLVDLRAGAVLWKKLLPFVQRGSGELKSHIFGATVFSPDGSQIVGYTDAGLAFYDAKSGRLITTAASPVWTHDQVSFAGEKALFARSKESERTEARNAYTLWSLDSGAPERALARGGMHYGGAIGDGEVALASSRIDRRCQRGETLVTLERRSISARSAAADSPPIAAKPSWPLPPESALAFCVPGLMVSAFDAPHGRLIIQAANDGKTSHGDLGVLDLATNDLKVISGGAGYFIDEGGFSADGRFIAASPGDAHGLGVWNAHTLRPLVTNIEAKLPKIAGQPPSLGASAFAPDGSTLAIEHDRTGLTLLDLPSLRVRWDATSPVSIESIELIDAKTVLVARDDGFLAEYMDGHLIRTLKGDGGVIASLALSPSRKLAATVHADQAIRVWDLEQGTVRAALVDFPDQEYVAFTPLGAYAGTSEVGDRIGWIFDKPTEGFRFEQFAKTFSRPNLVRARLAGSADDVAELPERPPRVEILDDPVLDAGHRTATVRVRASAAGRVDLVRAYVEGRPSASASICAASGEATLTVPLLSGRNRIAAIGFGARGASSNPALVDVEGAAAAGAPDIWVVAMGISRYPLLPPELQLEAADDDARGVAEAFAAQAGPAKAYKAAHVTRLLDDEVTGEAVIKALDGLAAMKPDDVAVISFAGHGEKPSANEDMMLVTGRTARTPESLRATGIGWPLLGERIAKLPGRVVVLLDACHAGHVTQELVAPNDALAAELCRDHRAGVVVFAASKGRQVSYEANTSRGLTLDPRAAEPIGGAGAHGYFTGALLKAMESPATDRDGDGAIEMSELIDEVRGRVLRASSGAQSPWVVRREVFGDFRIALPSGIAK